MAQLDPSLPFKIDLMNGREARESGPSLKALTAQERAKETKPE